MERLVYTSTARAGLKTADVFAIIETSVRNNAARNITGFLIEDAGRFLQLLEGPVASVEALFGTISQDDRHCDAAIIFRERAQERWFADWRMKQLISFSDGPAIEQLETALAGRDGGAHLVGLVKGFLGA